jgi:hypothetical protein
MRGELEKRCYKMVMKSLLILTDFGGAVGDIAEEA